MRVVSGESPSISDRLSVATRRLPQIDAALICGLLKAIEKSGRFIAAILGSAWTALTYFVVPFIVVAGTGPVEAWRRSVQTFKHTRGTALVGSFLLGLLSFLVILLLLAGGLICLPLASNSTALMAVGIAAPRTWSSRPSCSTTPRGR